MNAMTPDHLKRWFKRAIKTAINKGGTSISLATGREPEGGFMVGVEMVSMATETREPSPKELEILLKHAETKKFLGSWNEEGLIFLDISINVPLLEEAKRIAKEQDQRAIYDIKRDAVIYV